MFCSGWTDGHIDILAKAGYTMVQSLMVATPEGLRGAGLAPAMVDLLLHCRGGSSACAWFLYCLGVTFPAPLPQ